MSHTGPSKGHLSLPLVEQMVPALFIYGVSLSVDFTSEANSSYRETKSLSKLGRANHSSLILLLPVRPVFFPLHIETCLYQYFCYGFLFGSSSSCSNLRGQRTSHQDPPSCLSWGTFWTWAWTTHWRTLTGYEINAVCCLNVLNDSSDVWFRIARVPVKLNGEINTFEKCWYLISL